MPSSGTDRDIRRKIRISFWIILLFLAGMIVLQIVAENLYPPQEIENSLQLSRNQTYTFADFKYGPQDWRPYNYPLRIDAGTAGGNGSWYVMFISLDGTPWGGNPNMERRRHLVVDYRFENLSGMAAFHLYGIRKYSPECVTNRQDGYGTSGYMVIGSDLPGMPASGTEILPGFNNVEISLSNLPASAISGTEERYLLEFNKGPASGQDSLHFTTDLSFRKGQVITTPSRQGSFYITHTGGSPLSDIILMVAVNQTQPDTFRVHITSVPEAEDP
jgi:hypothetical protein